MSGRSVDDYGSPLFVAWQLTNGCDARCLACCEDSGIGRAWRNELASDEALSITQQVIDFGVPYVAFGGGEPLTVPYIWDLLERLSRAGVSIKLETNGHLIGREAAARMHALGVECIQISMDGATPESHERIRPGSNFAAALAAIDHLVALGSRPQWVFVPTRWNIHEVVPAFDAARSHGCSAFVTGPLMRLGRAAMHWNDLACDDAQWQRAVDALRLRAEDSGSEIALSIYPWDVITELETRLESPQAMLLIVPDGKVKLLNALPFCAGDLRRQPLADAWMGYRRAWRAPEVRNFILKCRAEPALLRHANETWTVPSVN